MSEWTQNVQVTVPFDGKANQVGRKYRESNGVFVFFFGQSMMSLLKTKTAA